MRPTTFWKNLVGNPVRYSMAIDTRNGKGLRNYAGFIKLRLGHSVGGSYLIPDALIGVGGTRYFLPSFFGPPALAFNIKEGKHTAYFNIDTGPPRATELVRLFVTVRSDDHMRSYEDGAQLYRCSFKGPARIVRNATGLCFPLRSSDFALEVFHHTMPEKAAKIRASRELWSSSWNLAGTRELANVAYGYFTSLPRIEAEEDLRRIAMASDGEIRFQTTSDRTREETLTLKVRRGNTLEMTTPLAFSVPCGIIAPTHLYIHPNVGVNPTYYEVIGPEIVRVGVNPKASLRFSGREISALGLDLKHFDYVVLGDASTITGLAAPHDEEETREVTHIEVIAHPWFEVGGAGREI